MATRDCLTCFPAPTMKHQSLLLLPGIARRVDFRISTKRTVEFPGASSKVGTGALTSAAVRFRSARGGSRAAELSRCEPFSVSDLWSPRRISVSVAMTSASDRRAPMSSIGAAALRLSMGASISRSAGVGNGIASRAAMRPSMYASISCSIQALAPVPAPAVPAPGFTGAGNFLALMRRSRC
jgi:hypothetical protein